MLLTIFSKLGHIDFQGRSPLSPPLPGKVIKLVFSTSPKALSLRFDLSLVYREVEVSASVLAPTMGPTQGWTPEACPLACLDPLRTSPVQPLLREQRIGEFL